MKKNNDLLKAIKRGGSVSVDPSKKIKKSTYQLHLDPDIIRAIDTLCESRKPEYYSRHSWIINAIMTKLKEETKG